MEKNYKLELYLKLDTQVDITLLAENSKIPILPKWTTTKVDYKDIMLHRGNYGLVLSASQLVIDVDKQNGGFESYERLKVLVPELASLQPNVETPRGGFHIYLTKPVTFAIKKKLKEYQGIDFLSKGCFVVIPPSKINDIEYKLNNLRIVEAPSSLLELLIGDSLFKENVEFVRGSKISRTSINDMLKSFDPSMPFDDWIKVGMALHDWDRVEGLDLWEEWSLLGSNYEKGITTKQWEYFDSSKIKKITIGSLIYAYKENNLKNEENEIKKLADLINSKNDIVHIYNECFSSINKVKLNDYNLDRVVKVLQNKITLLTGCKPKATELKKTFLKNKNKDAMFNLEWYKNWYYVNSHSKFINIETMEKYSTVSFNLENDHYVKNQNKNAFNFVSSNGLIKVVSHLTYDPKDDRLIIEEGGITKLNRFNKRSLPVSKNITENGALYIDRFLKHIGYLLGDENKDIFINWLAHQIQNKGVKIPWCPVIQSVEGLGKTFFIDVMKRLLGFDNIRVVGTSDVTGNYNDWATNKCLVIINEIRIIGGNRHQVVNELKPLITDDLINIRQKYVDSYTIKNTANYICFTNYKDAIPANATDRRYWFVFSPLKSLKELERISGEKNVTYFNNLYNGLECNYLELLRYLENHKISESFKNLKIAPMNKDKKYVVALEETTTEGLNEVKDVISSGVIGVTTECFIGDMVIKAIYKSSNNMVGYLSTSKINNIFKKLGYIVYPKKIWWDSKYCRVWVKDTKITYEEIKIALDSTLDS